jgi:hypothetical protein
LEQAETKISSNKDFKKGEDGLWIPQLDHNEDTSLDKGALFLPVNGRPTPAMSYQPHEEFTLARTPRSPSPMTKPKGVYSLEEIHIT